MPTSFKQDLVERQRRSGTLSEHLTFDDATGWGFLCRHCGHHEDTHIHDPKLSQRTAMEALRSHLSACQKGHKHGYR